MQEKKYAIRFGLAAIKAVGLKAMESMVEVRTNKGEFKDIFDFAKKMDAKNVNKKSIEALAKSGAFDKIATNRRQIFESFDIISSYANQQEKEANSDQMSFFKTLIDEKKSLPELKNFEDWSKKERLIKEFEAFGFFLNEHPLDDIVVELKKRGIIFCDKSDMGEIGDAFIVKMAGVIVSTKHRSGPKGRFAYVTISDPLGIYEAMIFDEALITRSRDLLADGSSVVIEAMIRKDDGGSRILIREVFALQNFLQEVTMQQNEFEDVKKLPKRKEFKKDSFEKKENQDSTKLNQNNNLQIERLKAKEIIPQIKIIIQKREPIVEIKSFLSQKIAPPNFEKYTKILIEVEKITIEVPQKYILDESDIARLKQIKDIEKIEF